MKLIFSIVEAPDDDRGDQFRGSKGLRDDQLKEAMETKERQYFIMRVRSAPNLELDVDG